MFQGIKQRIIENTNCAICMDTFYKPITIMCQHTYCKGCLLKMKDRKCPLCKIRFVIPKEYNRNIYNIGKLVNPKYIEGLEKKEEKLEIVKSVKDELRTEIYNEIVNNELEEYEHQYKTTNYFYKGMHFLTENILSAETKTMKALYHNIKSHMLLCCINISLFSFNYIFKNSDNTIINYIVNCSAMILIITNSILMTLYMLYVYIYNNIVRSLNSPANELLSQISRSRNPTSNDRSQTEHNNTSTIEDLFIQNSEENITLSEFIRRNVNDRIIIHPINVTSPQQPISSNDAANILGSSGIVNTNGSSGIVNTNGSNAMSGNAPSGNAMSGSAPSGNAMSGNAMSGVIYTSGTDGDMSDENGD